MRSQRPAVVLIGINIEVKINAEYFKIIFICTFRNASGSP